MPKIPSRFLKDLLKSGKLGSKDKIRMGLLIGFLLVCGIGISSSFLLGPDNTIEEGMEEAAEEMIEIVIQLPGEPPLNGYIDFSPSTPEKKRAYIDNS